MTDRGGRAAATKRRLASPDLVLFDLDDTLCDYAGARATRLGRAFSGDCHAGFAGLDATARERLVAASIEMHPHGADHFPDLLRRHGIEDAAAAEAAMTWYRGNRFYGLRLFDDAAETLGAVRALAAGAASGPPRRIGLITNGPAEVQREKVGLLGVDRLVDFVVISGEFGSAKPEPAIFHEALRLGDATPDRSVFIGDSPEFDIAGARAVGIATVWMNRGGDSWRWGEPGPDFEVRRLAEVVALVEGGGVPG